MFCYMLNYLFIGDGVIRPDKRYILCLYYFLEISFFVSKKVDLFKRLKFWRKLNRKKENKYIYEKQV